MNQKVKLLVWAIVILFLMNVATLGTILYHNYKQQALVDSTAISRSFTGNVINGRFFRQTLGFSNEQMNVFREANQQFRPQTAALMSAIDSSKVEMFTEMKKRKPDTLKLDLLSKRIGRLHGQLKHETYEFYLVLKNVCSEQQQLQLDKVFEPVFLNENLQTPHHGFQKGWNRANN
jgi:hemoglobin-like flavoprotein